MLVAAVVAVQLEAAQEVGALVVQRPAGQEAPQRLRQRRAGLQPRGPQPRGRPRRGRPRRGPRGGRGSLCSQRNRRTAGEGSCPPSKGGSASPRALGTASLPSFLILALMCFFQASPELVMLYQTSSRFSEKMLLQIPEGQRPLAVSPGPQHPALSPYRQEAPPHFPEGQGALSEGRGARLGPFQGSGTPTHLPESRCGTRGASSSDAP